MNDENSKTKKEVPFDDESEVVIFGGIKPLTAAQVVSFLLLSEKTMGACACGPCGPCAPCY